MSSKRIDRTMAGGLSDAVAIPDMAALLWADMPPRCLAAGSEGLIQDCYNPRIGTAVTCARGGDDVVWHSRPARILRPEDATTGLRTAAWDHRAATAGVLLGSPPDDHRILGAGRGGGRQWTSTVGCYGDRYDIVVASLYQMPNDPFEQLSSHRPLDYWGRSLFDHLLGLLPKLLTEDGRAYLMQLSILSQSENIRTLAGRGLRSRVLDFAFFEFSSVFEDTPRRSSAWRSSRTPTTCASATRTRWSPTCSRSRALRPARDGRPLPRRTADLARV